MLYAYQKAYLTSKPKRTEEMRRFRIKIKRQIPNLLILLGLGVAGVVGYPLLSFPFLNQHRHGQNTSSTAVIANSEPVNQPVVIDNVDYTKASNWFVGAPNTSVTQPGLKSQNKVQSYLLSVPKLGIKNMTVRIGSEDLDKSLIQYGNTTLPGEYGSPVIFGHSTLPVLYDPSSYMSVFTKVPELEIGDKIYATVDEVTYTYIVENYHVVEPTQLEVLEEDFGRQMIKLITCVPPGTYWKRGVIEARLLSN